jgi:hypothetical protein
LESGKFDRVFNSVSERVSEAKGTDPSELSLLILHHFFKGSIRAFTRISIGFKLLLPFLHVHFPESKTHNSQELSGLSCHFVDHFINVSLLSLIQIGNKSIGDLWVSAKHVLAVV